MFEDIERDIRLGKSEAELLAALKTRGLSEVNAKRFFDRAQAAVVKSPSPSPSATARFRVGRFFEDGTRNASGEGASAAVPKEIEGWNWGACLLGPVWGLRHGVFLGCLPFALVAVAFVILLPGALSGAAPSPRFVTFLNVMLTGSILLIAFALGAKGSAWAWQRRRWDSIEHFRSTQRRWAWSALVLIMIGIGTAALVVRLLRTSDAYRLAVEALTNSEEVEALVGTPLDTGLPMGSISMDGSGSGTAEIDFRLSGPKGEARALALATRHGGVWRLRALSLVDPQTREVTRIEIPDPGGETQ